MAWQRTGNNAYRERADALIGAFSGVVARSPSSFPYFLLGRAELETGDTGTRRYAARGKVALAAAARVGGSAAGADALRVEIVLEIAPGWHVNSFAPLEEALVATSLQLAPEGVSSGWRLSGLEHPQPEVVRLGFQDAPLSVYTGRVELRARLHPPQEPGAFVPIAVRLQACDDSVCLRPEEVVLRVGVATLLRSAAPATAELSTEQ